MRCQLVRGLLAPNEPAPIEATERAMGCGRTRCEARAIHDDQFAAAAAPVFRDSEIVAAITLPGARGLLICTPSGRS
jgi:hypothetical protein